jgi:hypothetical protein
MSTISTGEQSGAPLPIIHLAHLSAGRHCSTVARLQLVAQHLLRPATGAHSLTRTSSCPSPSRPAHHAHTAPHQAPSILPPPNQQPYPQRPLGSSIPSLSSQYPRGLAFEIWAPPRLTIFLSLSPPPVGDRANRRAGCDSINLCLLAATTSPPLLPRSDFPAAIQKH